METIRENIEELLAFHAVATERSFTRAGLSLGTSKALVSKQVKRLESHLKSKLFHRTTRTLSLTQHGEALLTYSQKIFDLSNEATKRLQDLNEDKSGLIRISAPVSLGDVFFPGILLQAKKALPQVNFEIDLSNENRDVEKDRVDFALRATDNHHPDLIARRIGKIRDVICASPAYLKKNKIGNHPRDLSEQDCILHSQEELWNQWTLTQGSQNLKLHVKGHYSTNQYSMARDLCRRGLGISRMPHYMVEQDLQNGTLTQLFPEFEIATHPLYLIYLKNEFATQKHKITRDLILKWFASHHRFFSSEQDAGPSIAL